jgi:hypothetical protein
LGIDATALGGRLGGVLPVITDGSRFYHRFVKTPAATRAQDARGEAPARRSRGATSSAVRIRGGHPGEAFPSTNPTRGGA